MQTVVETPAYLKAAADAKMTEAERKAAVDALAEDPEAGDLMEGAGGCRKVRLAGKGKGKSGGYRLITYFAHVDAPVFLLTVFAKGDKANLKKSERNALAVLTTRLIASLGPEAVRQRREPP
jgi:hypothetical protein